MPRSALQVICLGIMLLQCISTRAQQDFLEYLPPGTSLSERVRDKLAPYEDRVQAGEFDSEYQLIRLRESGIEMDNRLTFSLQGEFIEVEKAPLLVSEDFPDDLIVSGSMKGIAGSYFQYVSWKGEKRVQIYLGPTRSFYAYPLGEGLFGLFRLTPNGQNSCDAIPMGKGIRPQVSSSRANCIGTRYLRCLFVASKTVGDNEGYSSIQSTIVADLASTNSLLYASPNNLGYVQLEYAGLEVTTNSGWKEWDEVTGSDCTDGASVLGEMEDGLTGTGSMDFLEKMRKDYAADYVVLITDRLKGSSGVCGGLNGRAGAVGADASQAVIVVRYIRLNSNLTLLHEVGHLLGGNHEGSGAADSRGHASCGDNVQTVMATLGGCSPSAARQRLLSSPTSLYPGLSIVASDGTNNVKGKFDANACDHSQFQNDDIFYGSAASQYRFQEAFMQRDVKTKGQVTLENVVFDNNARVVVTAYGGIHNKSYTITGGARVRFTPLDNNGPARLAQKPPEIYQTVETEMPSIQITQANEASLKAFPNPFHTQLEIEYVLLEAQEIQISVFDLQGRLVDLLVDKLSSAGKHHLAWKPQKALPPGLYVVRMQAQGINEIQKVQVI
ncbi:MAG: T9SS type A sorting domain-containing protein [Bacteroidota bacterium]